MQMNSKKVLLEQLVPLIKEKLNTGKEVNIISTGNSMAPLFRHMRDQVRLKKVESSELEIYDMVFYQRDNGQYVLHRIVGKGENGFILRGDNQLCDEYPIRADQIIAKVESFCRKERNITCRNLCYRSYVMIWTHTVLFRKVYHKGKRCLSKLKKYLKN